jgi:hypothetical protein
LITASAQALNYGQIDLNTPSFNDVDGLHDANCIEPTVPGDVTKITPHQRKGSGEEFSLAARIWVEKLMEKVGAVLLPMLLSPPSSNS